MSWWSAGQQFLHFSMIVFVRPEIIRNGEIQYVTTRITDFTPWAITGYRLNECFLEM